ncbi:hypothetical protein K435DRAFT_963632 [Dendrothele bispora CBS 962.96]|uniref:Nnf1-domain-containing protein n=1 Tax=Dendrothele bispora (strain CBS 962.96) TaxID=1314807 RepID=A0A4S8MFB3_DENBC|nr:hypothetical protein K435DRAFT_963632 [Dendrothele bispora CBS 962.96]
MPSRQPSVRWGRFHSAIQLAIQRSAKKWTYADFAECFPLYCKEDRNGSMAAYNHISEYIETQINRDLETVFEQYSLQDNLDSLHQTITEAKQRQADGTAGKDVWREELEPVGLVCARTVPDLEAEAKRLREAVAEMEEANKHLGIELEESTDATREANARSTALLDKLDEVMELWKTALEESNIQDWTLQTAETARRRHI